MKKLILALAAIVLAVSAFAQAPHLKFKGIPIDGNYASFAQQLVKKGFRQIEYTEDGIMLIGNFMATPDVLVVVYPDPNSKVVSGVAAMIEAGDSWASIEGKYNDIVETYTEKYDAPSNQTEGFRGGVYSDYSRLLAVMEDRCDYMTSWELKEGRINIVPMYNVGTYYIACVYVDGQNSEALRQTIIDDI